MPVPAANASVLIKLFRSVKTSREVLFYVGDLVFILDRVAPLLGLKLISLHNIFPHVSEDQSLINGVLLFLKIFRIGDLVSCGGINFLISSICYATHQG